MLRHDGLLRDIMEERMFGKRTREIKKKDTAGRRLLKEHLHRFEKKQLKIGTLGV